MNTPNWNASPAQDRTCAHFAPLGTHTLITAIKTGRQRILLRTTYGGSTDTIYARAPEPGCVAVVRRYTLLPSCFVTMGCSLGLVRSEHAQLPAR
jgi:hypothetical protein